MNNDDWDSVSSDTPPDSTTDAWDAVSTPQSPPASAQRRLLPDNLVIEGDAFQPAHLSDRNIPVTPPSEEPQPQQHVIANPPDLPNRGAPGLPSISRTALPAPPVKRTAQFIVFITIALVLVISGLGAFYVVNTHVISSSAPLHRNYPSDPNQLYSQITNESPTFSDPLVDNRNNWKISSGSCAFTGGAYHVTVGNRVSCSCSCINNLNNFALQVQMSIWSNFEDGGGVFFGANNSDAYRILINDDGYYVLYSQTKTLQTDFNSAIAQGIEQTNVVTIIVNNSYFYLYINDQFIVTVNLAAYSQYSQGNVGLLAESVYEPTDVAFSDLKEWTL